jgi:hypothetical protein
VVGGDGRYSNFKISDNLIEIDRSDVIGLVFRGNVTGAEVLRNSITASFSVKATAIRNYAADLPASPNINNIYELNHISTGLRVEFKGLSWKSRSCMFGNQDEKGKPSSELPDNHSGHCPNLTE